MFAATPDRSDLSDSWIEDEEGARWRTMSGHGPSTGASGSGSSVLEVDEGCHLPRHTDSGEETIVVVEGRAEVVVEGDRAEVGSGGMALVPAGAVHEVRNAGRGVLRFVAVYAGTEVVTRYEDVVQPSGERERPPFS